MRSYCDRSPGDALAYYYFDFNDTEKQQTSNLISSLISQLCNGLAEVPREIGDMYNRSNFGRQKPTQQHLQGVLVEMTALFRNVYIIIDAVDECKDDQLDRLIHFIDVIRAYSSNVHLLLTSRPEHRIQLQLLPILTLPAISLVSNALESDIQLLIRSRLEMDRKLRKWSNEIKKEVEESITKSAGGM